MADKTLAGAQWQSWPDAFAEQVQRTPLAPAAVCGDQSWSYQEFAQWCHRLAARLTGHGVRQGDVVAVAGGPAPLTAAATVAIWQIGAVYLPVELDQPATRIGQILSAAAPAAVITGPGVTVPDAFARIRNIYAGTDSPGDATAPPRCPVGPGDAAYIIFTSGSSGEPKGVLVGHRGILGMARALATVLGTEAGARMLQFAPATFDASIAELTLALCSGATAVFPEPGETVSGAAIAEMISAYDISHLIMVPSILETVPEDQVPAGLHIVVAGERPGQGVLRQWRTRHRIRNAYGPTEATVCTTIGAESSDDIVIPIGRVILGCTVQVVDGQLRPVRPGETGELLIGGDGVALGYLGRPDLTARRFVTSPGGATRQYRSGDLARELPDGQFEFVGRLDRQIKLRGRRIEPGEIETVLLGHPAVRQAAVTASGGQLVAYVTAAGETDSQSLKLDLARSLPRYLVPDRIVLLGRLPVTRHGKVDHQALAGIASPARHGQPVIARSPQEHLLCRIFAEVLGCGQVDRSGNFFDLGGHSMLAAKLVLKVRAVLGADLSMRALLEAPTPAALAERLDLPDRLADSLDVLLPLRRAGRRPALFCVHPSTGLSWGYAGLLRYLADRPVVGLQARAMSDTTFSPGSVEELAADYLARVTEFQSAGPYHLLGYSFGGRVAFEMAARLQETGQQVGTVMMLDSSPPPESPFDASTEGFDRDAAVREYFLAILAETSPVPGGAWREAPLPQIKAELDRLGSPYSLLSNDHFQRMFELNKMNYVLSRRYVPRRKLRGRVHYVQATGRDGRDSSRPAERWAVHVDGETLVHPVTGTHNSLTQPASLAEIGPLLARELEQDELVHATQR